MFNKKKDNETDFCESYKSEILGTKPIEKGNSFFSTIVKLLTILILLAIIIGVSFYGYNYFITHQKVNNMELPPVSMQVSDDDLVVVEEEEAVEVDPVVSVQEEKSSVPLVVIPEVEELDIDEIAKDVKIAIAQSEEKEENKMKVEEVNKTDKEESLEVPTSSPDAKYLEELADLSKEIDKERNQ